MTATFQLTPGIAHYNAKFLVESNMLHSGDWTPYESGRDDDYYSGDCDCSYPLGSEIYWHTCCEDISLTQKMLDMFVYKDYEKNFEDSILDEGILKAICIDHIDNQYVLRNGHHRLYVAYKYDLSIPAWVGPYQGCNKHNDKVARKLPMSNGVIDRW